LEQLTSDLSIITALANKRGGDAPITAGLALLIPFQLFPALPSSRRSGGAMGRWGGGAVGRRGGWSAHLHPGELPGERERRQGRLIRYCYTRGAPKSSARIRRGARGVEGPREITIRIRKSRREAVTSSSRSRFPYSRFPFPRHFSF
jgi:hypothetical protein